MVFVTPVKAVGGGKVQEIGCVNASANTCTAIWGSVIISNDYIVVIEGNKLNTVTGTAPSLSVGGCGTFSAATVSSNAQTDISIWITKFTCGDGTANVVCNYSGTDTIRCKAVEISGLNSTSALTTASGSGSGSGTAFTSSVGSVTPAENTFCLVGTQVSVGAAGVTFTGMVHSIWQPLVILSGATATSMQSAFRTQWPAATSTIGDMTWTLGSNTWKWDSVLACWPTGPATTTTTETTTTTTTTTTTLTVTNTTTTTTTVPVEGVVQHDPNQILLLGISLLGLCLLVLVVVKRRR